MKKNKLCLFIALLICFAIGCKKESNDFNKQKESNSIAKSVSYFDFLKSIQSIDKLILKVKHKNTAESISAGASSFSDDFFTIDSTTISVLSGSNSSAIFSMILKPKNYFAANCFYNLYVKIDSLGIITQSIIKYTPTVETRNNGKKSFIGTHEILQNNQVNNATNTNSLCQMLEFVIPCDNGFVHEEDGPGDWCDVNGSTHYYVMSCSDGGGGGGSGTNGNGSTSTDGMVTVPDDIVVFGPCASEPAINQFISQTYNNNLAWANQHTYEFNQLTASLCGNPTLQNQNFVTWAIDYLIQHPNVSFSTFQNQFMGKSEGYEGPYDTFWDNPNLTFPPQALPTWNDFNAAFPRDTDPLYDTPEKMYNSIGGAVATFYVDEHTNTCAIRLSKALNYSGVIIPNISGQTFQGADGKYYFKAAYQINIWMRKTFGTNPATLTTPLNLNHHSYTQTQAGVNGINLPALLSGKKGIYSIYSSDFSWATGHADLLNDDGTCGNECHFADAPIARLDIWVLN